MSETSSQQPSVAPSSEASDIAALQRYDTNAITPDRLSEKVDVQVLREVDGLTHRNRELDINRLIDYLCAGLENKAITAGPDSTPSTMSEYEASSAVFEWIKSRYPAFFGDTDTLSELRGLTTISENHILLGSLREDYWCGTLTSDFEVTPTSRDRYQVVIPIVSLLAEHILSQYHTDRALAKKNAKTAISLTILEEASNADLTFDDIDTAVEDAKELLRDKPQ